MLCSERYNGFSKGPSGDHRPPGSSKRMSSSKLDSFVLPSLRPKISPKPPTTANMHSLYELFASCIISLKLEPTWSSSFNRRLDFLKIHFLQFSKGILTSSRWYYFSIISSEITIFKHIHHLARLNFPDLLIFHSLFKKSRVFQL